MAVRPPHSREEWEVWTDACIQTNRRHLIPEDIGIRVWPEGITQGPSWFTLAEDHPFKGAEFCWRCIAEAQGFPAFEVIPHRRTELSASASPVLASQRVSIQCQSPL